MQVLKRLYDRIRRIVGKKELDPASQQCVLTYGVNLSPKTILLL